ncbi:MAG TPA: efflux RND transporter periplasmic adaptor subunit [Bryobacterales bacterium]|nr:efflux RND transporter periplasmic adaptor subunit [Bryobacterales bacterium]
MKRKLILPIILVGAGIAGLVAFRGFQRQPEDKIVLSGNIELTEVNIAFKTAGKLIERMVDEGDPVTKGMVIARLDRDQLLRQQERERAALAAAQMQLAQAQTAVNWQQQTLHADLEQRRADLRAYEAQYEQLKNGSRPQEIQDAKAAVEAAQAVYDRARNDWERAQALFKNDDISRAQYDQYRTQFDSAQAALKQAQQRADLVLIGPRQEQIEAARAQMERARAALKMAEANELELKRRNQEVSARRAEIERERAQIALIDSQLEDTVAVSPIEGVVLVKAADVGEVLAPGATVVTIGDMDHPWLRGYIGERDLGRVKLGTKAKITSDSYPGKAYWGRVSFISSEAEFTPKQIQTQEERVKLVYRIKIDVDNPRRELKLNMPVDAEILVGQQY